MITLAPLELIALLVATTLLAWRGGYHSATWRDPDDRACREHDERTAALDRIHDRRSS